MTGGRLVALAAVLIPALGAAQPYVYMPFKMINTQAQPFDYYVDGRRPMPAGLQLSGVQQAAEQAWDTWNALQCAYPKARSRGLTGGVVPDPPNRYDLFSTTPVWLMSGDPEFDDVLGPAPFFILAVTVPIAVGGALKTCDIYLNGDANWTLNVPPPSTALDVQSVVTHETGHCLGLGHNGNYPSGDVMVESVAPGETRRTLGVNDVAALCGRYPLPGNYTAPCLADGGCNGPELKCLTQPVTSGITTTVCSKGCTPTSGGGECDLPTTCQASPAFAPSFSGACLLPGSAVTQVGAPCSNAGDCGAPNSQCLPPTTKITGTTFWEAGYCTQDCAPGQPPCPAGAECIDFGGGTLACLQQCRVGLSDCRPGYSCATVDSGGAVCLPACKVNMDCADPSSFDCRICDGLCVAKQNSSGQIGDRCTSDATCGPGQSCEPTLGGQCTLQCARGCGTCPSGSTCTSMPNGLFCLRDCAGPGTCPPGLRCADTVSGKGCLGACQSNLDCPVGQGCFQGECYTPVEDAGCTTLCTGPDGGKPINPGADGGTGGGGGSGGCGCGSTDGALSLMLLAWAGIFLSRRQAWRRQ